MSIPQAAANVKIAPSQSDRAEILALADIALAEANRFRERWLAMGDGLAWRRWQAALGDRAQLLAEVGYVA